MAACTVNFLICFDFFQWINYGGDFLWQVVSLSQSNFHANEIFGTLSACNFQDNLVGDLF